MTADDYKAALNSTMAMMANMQRQNERFSKALKKYAHGDWENLTLFDQGKIARVALGEEIK